MFDTLRGLVLREFSKNSSARIFNDPTVIPIEQTTEGWYCLLRDRSVIEVFDEGGTRPVDVEFAVALLGAASRRFPLATWFIPRVDRAAVCASCGGSGQTSLPEPIASKVRCRCGGLGWVAEP